MRAATDLLSQYALYHRDRRNIASHFVGVPMIALAHHVGNSGTGAWLAWGIGFFVVGWIIQFIGHWYEGRKPAFVDDIVGLLVGPMFVTAEALFSLGWGKPLLHEIERRVGPTMMRDLARIV